MDKFANLPQPLKWLAGVLGIGALMGTGAVIMSGAWLFLLVLVLLLAVVLGGYLLWTAWRRKQRSAQLGGELAQHSSASPRGISDPGQRARLDDLRKKFETGVREYKSRGKDLYKLPWYVIVGEPGSGKTEAIRHSNVGFPPGMQDEFQGVGGTINMNWWFTNNAVLLDTAGRLMFDEVRPGETSEWKEFLTLLKKNRPNCPINGLLLVIPSDSLIKDSADDIQRKAGKIAQQLDVIQRVLDVRFPVFVIVTKCDKVNGFREFFDGVTDPQLQAQMMGWSNPTPLDDPFRPDLVDQHLSQVVHRLRRRRSGLLKDPVPDGPSARRVDEVDSLYALPHSLSLLAPRLRRYLETIFVAGEWSAKPLFLRGIYFSSSMREGSALDAELAEAIGMPVEELPEGKVWERERAYFLRDLFLEKVFRERGLVTRASNTARMLRTQMFLLYGCGALALVLFVFFAWFGTRNLENTVRTQSQAWMNATNWWPKTKILKQSIIPQNAEGVYASQAVGDIEYSGKQVSIGKFHALLREQATKPMKFNWMMPTLAARYNGDSRKAQRIVFEGGVVRPLVEAARDRMRAALERRAAGEPGQTEAFLSLLQIEGDLLTRDKGANKGTVSAEKARTFLTSLLNYATGTEVVPDSSFSNLVEIMSWTYSENSEGRGQWPPSGLSSVVGDPGPLTSYPDLRIAFDLYLTNFTAGAERQLGEWKLVSSIAEILGRARESETALFKAFDGNAERDVERRWEELAGIARELDVKRAAASQASIFQGNLSLVGAHSRFAGLVGTGGELQRVGSNATYYASLCGQRDGEAFRQIADRIKKLQSEFLERVERETKGGTAGFAALDKSYLRSPGFIERGGFYQESFRLASSPTNFAGTSLIGSRGEPWQHFQSNSLRRAQSRAEDYNGEFKESFKPSVGTLAERARRRQMGVFFTNYMAEAERKMGGILGFPLVKPPAPLMTTENFGRAYRELDSITKDIAAPAMPPAPAGEGQAWNQFVRRSTNMTAVALAILGDQSTPSDCVVTLLKNEDKDFDRWRETRRDIQLMGISDPNAKRTQNTEDTKLGAIGADRQLTLHLYKSATGKNDPSIKDNLAIYEAGEWGALSLLHQHNGQKQKDDPTAWVVSWPVRPQDGTGEIRLKLKFAGELPDLKSWPAR